MILELHTHTDHSRGKKIYYDAISRPEDMVKATKKVADGIFITDHDKISGAIEAQKYAKKYGVNVFLGEEISCSSGDIVALGIQELIKPGMDVEDTMDAIHAQGGVGIAAHPFDIRRAGTGAECVKCDVVEIFNAMNLDRHSNNKAKKFARDNNMPVVAGSDAHWTEMLGYGQIEVKSNDLDGILKEIKKGQAKIVKNDYIPINTIMNMSLGKLRKSYDPTMEYIHKNYGFPKKQIARSLLSIVTKEKRGLGGFYKFLALVAFGSVILYGQARRIV